MAAKGNSFCKVEKNLQGLDAILKSAACEWLLIFLMLVDALLSYVLTKFAYICKLPTPCILCSRLDHLLGKEKNSYRNLLCSDHRLEISSLISCHEHNKLVDCNEICDACLCSFATYNKTKFNPKMQRLLVGKLRLDTCMNGASDELSNRNLIPRRIGAKPCSCCSKLWRPGPNAQGLLQLKSSLNADSKPNVPLTRRLDSRHNLKKTRKTGFDLLSHVGYTELKITSDSESEILLSQDDADIDGSIICEKSDLKEDSVLQYKTQIPLKRHCNDHNQVKPSIKFFDSRPSPLESYTQVEVRKAVKSVASDATTNLNWLPADQIANPSALPELISPDDPPSSIEKSKFMSSLSQDSIFSCQPELIPLDCAPRFVGVSVTSEETGTYDAGFAFLNKLEDHSTLINTAVGGCPKTDDVYESAIKNINDMDQSNVHESSVGDKKQEIFTFATELSSEKEQNLLQFLILNTSAEQMNPSSNDEQNNSIGCDDLQEAMVSQFNMIRVLNKASSVESDIKSLDGSNVSDVEGESIVDRLRRQVEYDRKCIGSLYKELEEERSASEVAANQAMAMITRLQEEKAAVHMEALQYLRMMEEQAEYDVEALEKANDLLTEKEKEIQDLEAELEFYKATHPNDIRVEIEHERSHGVNEVIVTAEKNNGRCGEYNSNYSFKSTSVEVSKGRNRSSNLETSSLEFEDRKIHIQLCLKGLEVELNKITTDRLLASTPNRIESENWNTEGKGEESTDAEESQRNKEQNGSSMHMDKHTFNGTVAAAEVLVDSDNNGRYGHDENFDDQTSCVDKREVELLALEHKISVLRGRLEALQTHYDFLEQTLHSLHHGEEGLQFIQDIAYQLQELCKLGIRLDCQFGS